MTIQDQAPASASGRLNRAASIAARAGLALTILGALALLLSALGSRWEWWGFRTGFTVLRATLYGGLLVIVVVLAGLVLGLLARTGRTLLVSIVSLVLLAAVAAAPVGHLRAAGRVPPIHDISTDLDDPPRFVAVLPLRRGAPNSAEPGGADLAAQQRAGYPDLGPGRFPEAPERVFARATDVARGLGWEIVRRSRRRGASRRPIAPDGSAFATTSWSASGRTAREAGSTSARSPASGGAISGPTPAGSSASWRRYGRPRPARRRASNRRGAGRERDGVAATSRSSSTIRMDSPSGPLTYWTLRFHRLMSEQECERRPCRQNPA